MKQGGRHTVKLCRWQGRAWGQGYFLQQSQGRPGQNPHPHFQCVCSTWATPGARPCLPAAHFQRCHWEGRAVQISGLYQIPPAPGLSPSRPGARGRAYTCRSGCGIAYMSPGLRTARPCSPVRTAQPLPWLPHGSCYPNNNIQLPGTSMEGGRGRTGSSTQGSAPRKQKQKRSPGH